MHKSVHAAVFAGFAFVATSQLSAQRGGGDWMTIGNDAQRSSWLRGDPKISVDTMSKPGFELVWKVKLKNEPRQMSSLTPPALLDFYISYRGFRTLGFIGGSSGNITAIDTDLGRLEWEKTFPSTSRSASTVTCPGGMTSSVTRPTVAAYPPSFGGRGFGRGGPAKSGVGEPHEGAVTLKEPPFRPPAPPPAPVATSARRPAAPAVNVFAPRAQYVNAITSDGKFHALYVSNGEEPNPPVDFLPPNANAIGLIVFDNTAYVATVNGCGGVENGLWALNLGTKKVSHWKSNDGPAGFAAGPDGTLFVSAGSEVVALEPGTLMMKGSYKAGGRLTSPPVVFDYKGKDLIAVTSGDGQLHVLDSEAMGKQPSSKTTVATPVGGALASWQDAAGTRWILAPAGGAIAAYKIVEEKGATSLQRGWVSRDMVSPLPPAIVNGVVFALSGGDQRRSSNAVLYALDGLTGKELWNSGSAITSFVRSGGLAAGGGRVYVGGHDGTQYAFGFPMEH